MFCLLTRSQQFLTSKVVSVHTLSCLFAVRSSHTMRRDAFTEKNPRKEASRYRQGYIHQRGEPNLPVRMVSTFSFLFYPPLCAVSIALMCGMGAAWGAAWGCGGAGARGGVHATRPKMALVPIWPTASRERSGRRSRQTYESQSTRSRESS